MIDMDGLETTEYLADAALVTPGVWYFEVTARTRDGRTAAAMNKIQVNDVYYPGVDRGEVS